MPSSFGTPGPVSVTSIVTLLPRRSSGARSRAPARGPAAAASIALSIRLPTIVSSDVGLDAGLGQARVLGERELDTALGRDGGLGQQQRGDLGRLDPLADRLGQPGGLAGDVERVADRGL